MPRWWRYWVADVAKGTRLWLLHQGMRALPTRAASALGGRLARFSGPRTCPVAQRRAAELIRALRPDLATDPAALAAALSSLWSCIGRTHGEFAAEHRLWREGRIAVEGAEHLAGDGPLVVAGVHLGNWELLPIALAHLGRRVIDVYQPQPNRFVNRIAMRSRLLSADAAGLATGRAGPDLFRLVAPSPTAGAELVRAVKAGWTMMMYVDEEVVAGRCHAPSFGGSPAGDGNLARAVRIARLTGARIVPAHVERLPDARFVVRFGPAVEGKGEEAVAALDAALSAVVRRHLCQWFMLLSYRGAVPPAG
jgi:KDO2-lipid IV(A) lauroyltransferase